MTVASATIVPRRFADARLAGAIGAIALTGLCVRLYFSDGPLGNDEIWSLLNLRPISHFWRILWGVSHDNNHFLNSLWLYYAWSWSHDLTWLRLPSILAGALAIPLLARLGARHGPAAGVAAAVLTAFSFFQATYSMEARGYATATLALMAAYDALERAFDAPTAGARWALAIASGLAFFSHLASGPILALFVLIAFAETFRRRRSLATAARATFALFWPVALAMAPTLLFVLAGVRETGEFHIGNFVPFAASHVVAAVANMEMTTLGLDPASQPQAIFALFGLPPLIIAAILVCALPERRIAYFVLIFAPPAAALLLRLPNTHAPRYFFAASPFLLLLLAETIEVAWRAGAPGRALAALLLAASLLGDFAALARLSAGEAAPWTDALASVAASDRPTLASSFDFNVGKSVDHFNRDRAATVELTPSSEICKRRPGWYIAELPDHATPEPALTVPGEGCALAFKLVGVYNRDVPWLSLWALYRSADGGG